MNNRDRWGDSGVTFVFFLIGCAFVWYAAGWRWSVAALFLGFAIAGEVQRKGNQVLDEIEKRR